jgi:hypothetical protein
MERGKVGSIQEDEEGTGNACGRYENAQGGHGRDEEGIAKA